ncbi:phage portal protein [Pararhizobium sp. BT-229]|uniref:phage portal protein n=1 Tax=Pararhizobium sp. BT-229 TaxID=2986923 RepID=UPI0021F7B1D1|nr:phage portal protein [Pararhizobium sp. BT-229]MCV9960742.1 phage portal protein [Pararhizobium sp. BT-229]
MGVKSWLASMIGSPQRQNIAFEESFWREDLAIGMPSRAGETVNWKTTLGVTTALRCGLTITDGIATVPCKIMRKDPATGRRTEATDHPLYDVLNYQFNDWMDPLQGLETIAIHTVFTGNAIAFVNMVGPRNARRIAEIIPIMPECVRVEQKDDYSLVYHVTSRDGVSEVFPAEAIWHMRGPSWNGYLGMDVTRLAREALGLAMATQNAHAQRFGNGIQTSGVYAVDGNLDDSQYKRLSKYINKHHVGARNSGKPMLMDRNAKWQPMDLTGIDAQHLETRKHQVEEICRGFGVLPIMVGHSDKTATYASAEQMFLAHAVHTIRPWHRRFERSMKMSLLTREEVRAGYYIKFFDTELLRGAAKDRADYYWKFFQMGMSPNDILELEDQDGFEGGNIHLVPSALQTVENAKKAAPAGKTGRKDEPSLDEEEKNSAPKSEEEQES